MNEQDKLQLSRFEKNTLKAFIFIFWVSALLIWNILNWHRRVFSHFRMELPELTALFLQGFGSYSPFISATLFSVFMIWQIYHPHSKTILHSAWALAIWIIYLLLVFFAASLPFFPPCAAE